MKNRIRIVTAVALALVSTGAYTQDNAAAERARIASERIAAEAERRARAETESEAAAARSRTAAELAAATTSTAPPAAAAPAAPPTVREPVREQPPSVASPTAASGSNRDESAAIGNRAQGSQDGLSPLLEQLKTLGELKDSGYVTEEEFQRIKSRLLEDSLR